MTEAEQFEICLQQAQRITAAYRAEAPEGCDPQNTFAVTAIVVTVIGAGVSAYGQYQAGKQSDLMAQYNAHQQEFNARVQLMTMQAEANARKATADANLRFRTAEAQAKFQNARLLAKQAESDSANVRESIRRKAEESGRFIGAQRAKIAASGIVEASGTPLDILAETAGKIQLEREDTLYADSVNRATLFREAQLQKFGGELAIAGATLDRNSEVAGIALSRAASDVEYRRSLRDAEITRLSGKAERRTATYQAAGTLLSGLSSAAGSYSSIK